MCRTSQPAASGGSHPTAADEAGGLTLLLAIFGRSATSAVIDFPLTGKWRLLLASDPNFGKGPPDFPVCAIAHDSAACELQAERKSHTQ
jgi:hypothetical protein